MKVSDIKKTMKKFDKVKPKAYVISILVLVAGMLISYLLQDIRLSIIFFILWFDKLVLGYAGFISQLGLEFTSFAVILTGLTYDLYFAAIYTFITSTIMVGLNWHITRGSEPNWPPFFPGPDQIVDVIGAAIANMLKTLPIVYAVTLATIGKYLVQIIKDKIILYDKPPEVMRMANIFLNFIIAAYFDAHLAAFIS